MEYRTFNKLFEESMKDDEFKKEYEALQPEYELIKEMITLRKQNNMTQQELAILSGIPQADISRIENGNANPTFSTLKKIANAFNKQLKIKFI